MSYDLDDYQAEAHTGYWDVSLAFWVSSEARGTFCMYMWAVGTSDWRSL